MAGTTNAGFIFLIYFNCHFRSIYSNDMNAFQKGWYLIYTKPRHEKKVNTYLSEQGITSFLPLKKRVREQNGRKKIVEEPLFPSYVFIYLNDVVNYYTGIDAGGSLYYVKEGKKIACVSDSVINNIRIVSSQDDDVEISNVRFRPGQKTIISEGALTGLSCEIVEVNSKQKLLVRIDLLQRNILLTMSERSLVAI